MILPYSLAAIDMDATLLGPDHRVGAANRAALDRLRSTGIAVVLASGRRHENLMRFHAELGIEGPAISGNGALVRCSRTGDTWHERLLDPDSALALLEDGVARGMTQVVEHADGGSYVAGVTRHSDILAHRTGNPITAVGDLPSRGGSDIRKVIWIHDPEEIDGLAEPVSRRWRSTFSTIVTDPEYLEFMAIGVDKAPALEAVALRLGIAREHVLAFGDGANDAGMLRWAGLGFAMAHGRPEALAAADHVAPPGDPADAFARAVDLLFELHSHR
ncbi:MAG: Cof-type HAD-IIB family hydrolase [Armatimonadota bacterium]